MKSLFKISAEAQILASALIEGEGELGPWLEDQLAINQNELQEKSINYGYAIKSIENDVEAIDKEIDRLEGLKQARKKAIDKMEFAVLEALTIYGI